MYLWDKTVKKSLALKAIQLIAIVAVLFLGWAGAAFGQTALTNTAVTETQVSALIPTAAPTLNVVANNIQDGATVGSTDCVGSVQSAAFDLGGGLFLYAYELECHCGPNWDVGYAAVGGGLKVPLNGNVPQFADVNNDASASEDSFHTTTTGFRPYRFGLTNFNQNTAFGTSSGDFTTSANVDVGGTRVEFLNGGGIFLTGDVAGFVTNSPPRIERAAHLGGSSTVFDMVVPSPVVSRLDKFFDPEIGEPGQGPDQIEIGQQSSTQYSFAIEYVNTNPANLSARLVDTVPAEFDVQSATLTSGTGILNVFRTGKGRKNQSSTKITLDLAAGPQSARIDVVVTTRALPNRKRYKPTSCGLIPLNSGPMFVFQVDPDTGEIVRDDEGNKVILFGPSVVLDIVAVIDPNNPDNDGDGIPNDVEARELGTNPCYADTDGDGLSDNEEQGAFNTEDPTLAIQSLPQFDPNDVHFQCLFQGTSPILADTDGDGLTDGAGEAAHGTDSGRPDTDFDFLKDGDEVALGTDPLNSDTDADGALDGQDADPLDPTVQ